MVHFHFLAGSLYHKKLSNIVVRELIYKGVMFPGFIRGFPQIGDTPIAGRFICERENIPSFEMDDDKGYPP